MNIVDRILNRFRARRPDILAMEADTQKDIEADLFNRARRTVGAFSELADQEWWQGLDGFRRYTRSFPDDDLGRSAERHVRSLRSDR